MENEIEIYMLFTTIYCGLWQRKRDPQGDIKVQTRVNLHNK